ncbi:MAG: hypothetical protein EBR53_07995 [Actinobacteria bacterium]|nr:hypothetical protein [Actinomycetota bacterium]
MKKLSLALTAILLWFAIPAVTANAVAIGQSCASTPLGARVSIRVSGKPVIVVCRRVSGRKRWIRAAVQTIVTTTTTSTTSTSTSTSTTTTIPEPVINYTDVADSIDPTLHTITVEGMQARTYLLFVPSTYSKDKPIPLMLGFHGLGGSARTFNNSLNLSSYSQDLNFILAIPNGWGTEAGTQNSWNAGNCCGSANSNQIDDVGLVRAIVDSLTRKYTIDSSRVWAIGFSNGGMLSYRLACEFSEKITAIGVGGGAMMLNSCSPPRVVSVVHLHGNLDETVPIDGGGQFFVKPVIESFKLVNSANKCSPMVYEVTSDFLSETTKAVCSDGTEAKLINQYNDAHDWTSDWTKEIIRFLFAHPRN